MTTFVLDPAVDIVASIPRFNRPCRRKQYRDKHFEGGEDAWRKKLEESSTVYVGNLSCYTNEYQLYELFNKCGSIKRVVMGLDRIKKTPCGFCFVEYDERRSALKSVSYLNMTQLDGRDIHVDIDAGFVEGRQYGRGPSGGQLADERQRESERFGGYVAPGHRVGYQGPILTRSITIVSCLALISLILIACQLEHAASDIVIKAPLLTWSTPRISNIDKGRYISFGTVRQAQLTESRTQFEKDLAQFLVNLMKASKPTLMKAFIQATLADKQLKEIAIGLFFNSTDSSEAGEAGEDNE